MAADNRAKKPASVATHDDEESRRASLLAALDAEAGEEEGECDV